MGDYEIRNGEINPPIPEPVPAGTYGDRLPITQEPMHIHPECVNGHDHSVLVHWHVRGGVPHTHRPLITWSGTPVFKEEDQ